MGRYSSTSPEEFFRICSVFADAETWGECVRRFHRPIAAVALHTAGRLGDTSTETAEDLIQETRLKLCADQCQLLREVCRQHSDGQTD
jgi:RNA polymerase sigma-70 factor, ECF subfamily